MNPIEGHTNLRTRFDQLIRDRAFPQSSLFYGLTSIGKKLVALELVGKLFCRGENKGHKKPCGQCHSCVMLEGNTHPDLFIIEPTAPKSSSAQGEGQTTKTEAAGTIKIEQIHELKPKLVHFPLMAEHQVVIIDEAEKMTREAANSLLKILEEPRPQQIFILVTSQYHRVLPTLRSRCIKFAFAPLGFQEIRKIISGMVEGTVDEGWLKFLTRCFQGSIGPVVTILDSSLSITDLKGLLGGTPDFMNITETVKEILERDVDLHLFLQMVRQYRLEAIKASDDKRSPSFMELDFFEKIRQAEFQLSRHIAKDFVLENLFL